VVFGMQNEISLNPALSTKNLVRVNWE